jgi:predicted transcriptional regulator
MGLYENIRNEPVSQLAIREPVVVSADATVRDAIGCMRERNLGCAIVVDDDRRPVGLFAESKLTRLLSETPGAVYDPILEHVDKNWPTVSLNDPISCVLSALEFANIRFLIVVDDQGRLAGLTGQKGLMEYIAEHFPRQVIVQRIGGKPYPAHREGA